MKKIKYVTKFNNNLTEACSEGQKFEIKPIIEYEVVQVAQKISEASDEVVVVRKLVKVKEYNRKEYINSFKDDVGVLNIMKKVALSGDQTLLNQRGHLEGQGFVDLTKMPEDYIEAVKAHKKGEQAMKSDVARGKTMEAVAGMSKKDIDKYINEKFEAYMASLKTQNVTKKEGEE